MSRFRIIIILLLCLAIPMAGWASSMDGWLCLPHTDQPGSNTAAAHHDADNQPDQHAAAAHHDAAFDDSCDDGQCKHKCACGCGMGSCSSTCLAFLGQQSAFPWHATSDMILSLVEQQPAAARGTPPLRPPIV